MALIWATLNAALIALYPKGMSDVDLLNAFTEAELVGRGLDSLMPELLGRLKRCTRLEDGDLWYDPLRSPNPSICTLLSDAGSISRLVADLSLNNANLMELVRTAMKSNPHMNCRILHHLSHLPKDVLVSAIQHLANVFILTDQDPHVLMQLLSVVKVPETNLQVLRLITAIANRDRMAMLSELSAWLAVNDIGVVPEEPPAELVALWERMVITSEAELWGREPIFMNYVVMNFKFQNVVEHEKCFVVKKWKSVFSTFAGKRRRRGNSDATKLWTDYLLPLIEKQCPMFFGALDQRVAYLRNGEYLDTLVVVRNAHIVEDTAAMLEVIAARMGTFPKILFVEDLEKKLVSNIAEWVTLVMANSDQITPQVAGMMMGVALLNGVPILRSFDASVCANLAASTGYEKEPVLQGLGLVVALNEFENAFTGSEFCQQLQRGDGAAMMDLVLDMHSDNDLAELIMTVDLPSDVKEVAVGRLQSRMENNTDLVEQLLSFGSGFVRAVFDNIGVLEPLMLSSECNNPLVMETFMNEMLEYKILDDGYSVIDFTVGDTFVKLVEVFAAACDEHVATVKSYHYVARVLDGLARKCVNWHSTNRVCVKLFSEMSVKLASYVTLPRLEGSFNGLDSYWDTVIRKTEEYNGAPRNTFIRGGRTFIRDYRSDLYMRMGILNFVAVYPILRRDGWYRRRIGRMRGMIDEYIGSAHNWPDAPDSVKRFWTEDARWYIDQHCQTNVFPTHMLVDRANVLESSMRMSNLLVPSRIPRIEFIDEPGIDCGALYRDWYTLIVTEIMDPARGLFSLAPGTHNTFGIAKFSETSIDKAAHALTMNFVGKVVARAVIDRLPLGIRFTNSLYKRILGLKVSLEDLKADNPQVYAGVQTSLNFDPETLDGMEMTFDAEVRNGNNGQITYVSMRDDGQLNVAVTSENVREYANALAKYNLVTLIEDETTPFVEGFHSMIKTEARRNLSLEQLARQILGSPEIGVEDLISHLSYDGLNIDGSPNNYAGYTPDSDQIKWLHNQLRSYSQKNLRLFVKFVTGTDQVPFGGLGNLKDTTGVPAPIRIHRREYQPGMFPSASACFFTFHLPTYSNEHELQSRLKIAITKGNEHGFGRS